MILYERLSRGSVTSPAGLEVLGSLAREQAGAVISGDRAVAHGLEAMAHPQLPQPSSQSSREVM